MLIWNINTADELVNGMMGNVVDFVRNADGQVTSIVVAFDFDSAGEMQREKYPHISLKYQHENGTPIFAIETAQLIGRKKKLSTARAKIYQFPLRLSYACTAHKMQGQTVKTGTKLVVHWPTRQVDGLIYVMLGRCESIKDLFITGKFDPKKISCSEEAKIESESLKARAAARPKFQDFFEMSEFS